MIHYKQILREEFLVQLREEFVFSGFTPNIAYNIPVMVKEIGFSTAPHRIKKWALSSFCNLWIKATNIQLPVEDRILATGISLKIMCLNIPNFRTNNFVHSRNMWPIIFQHQKRAVARYLKHIILPGTYFSPHSLIKTNWRKTK